MSDDDAPTAPLMTLGNLFSNDIMEAQFNPEQLERTVSVAYARLAVIGHSHEVLQYSFRKNESLSFELCFDSLCGAGSKIEAANQLDAMTAGSREAQDIASGGPPDVLFLWPGVLKMRVRIIDLKYKYKRFAWAKGGQPTWWSVQVNVEEARTTRLYAEDIRRNGLMRG